MGAKPLFVFQGSQWATDTLYGRIENLLLDFFRGAKLEKMSLQGIDHVIVCTVVDGKIYLRVYNIGFAKSGTKVIKFIRIIFWKSKCVRLFLSVLLFVPFFQILSLRFSVLSFFCSV